MAIERRPDGMPASQDERKLRRLLCVAHEELPYMDDGEAQGPTLDWMRCSVTDIENRIREINLKKFERSQNDSSVS
jgi:hypothetical protein